MTNASRRFSALHGGAAAIRERLFVLEFAGTQKAIRKLIQKSIAGSTTTKEGNHERKRN
jgi:hypothetical protein